MRPLTKVCLAIVAVAALGQALLVAALVWPQRQVALHLFSHWPLYRGVLLGLSVVVALLALGLLALALLRRTTVPHLVIHQARGRLLLNQQAIESATAKAVVRAHPVKGVAVQVRLPRHRPAKVAVTAYSLNHTDLVQAGRDIERTVRDQLTTVLGVAVGRIRVYLHPGQAAPPSATTVM